jgi:hypothetical protein
MNHSETDRNKFLSSLESLEVNRKGPGDREVHWQKKSLAIILQNQGPGLGRDTAVSNNNLAVYYYQQVLELTTIPAQLERSLKLLENSYFRSYSNLFESM